MQVAMEYGVKPVNMALGAIAGIAFLLTKADENKLPEDLRFNWRKMNDEQIEKLLQWIWKVTSVKNVSDLTGYVKDAKSRLLKLVQ